MSTGLIIALDYADKAQAQQLVASIDPRTCIVKIGSELFTRYGPAVVEAIMAKGFRVFLDLKFHDIPQTVAKACLSAAALGVWMINVHAAGGTQMMIAAREALESYGPKRPLLIAVTVLTSMAQTNLDEQEITQKIQDRVLLLARMAQTAGIDGVVCAPEESMAVKQICGASFITVTPGIRLQDSDQHDQIRTMTPTQAQKMQSDYLVIGRPITLADNPQQEIDRILRQLSLP